MISENVIDDTPATFGQQATALALGLAHAEDALFDFTRGEVDAVVDTSGRAYMLRAAQEGLREKEKHLREIIDCSPDVITVVNRGGVILSQSNAVRRVLGYLPGELLGKSLFTYTHKADLIDVFSTFLNVAEGFHESGTLRFRHRAKDDSYQILEAALCRMQDSADVAVVLSLRPIADRYPPKGAAPIVAELEANEGTERKNRFGAWAASGTPQPIGAFDSFPDFLVLDSLGCVQRESATLPRRLGLQQEPMMGRCLFDFVHPEDLSPFQLLLSQSLRKNSPSAFESKFRYRMPDGTWSLMAVTIGTLQPVASTAAILIFRDTATTVEKEGVKAREACLAKASLAKDRFLAMLSHELLTPLTPVLLGLSELEEEEQFAEARPIFAMMRRNIVTQTRLLEELSYFTTVDQHKVRLHLEVIDLHDAIRFVLEICRGEIAAAGVSVLLELKADDKIVWADSVRLQQVMWNLLKNAIKFSPPGETIIISSENDQAGRVTVSFVDRGIGIAPELLPLVFDPFQQGAESIRSSYGGLGLGLFIAKGLADAQLADLTVDSAGHGQGATFRLSLATVTHPVSAGISSGTQFDLVGAKLHHEEKT